MKILPDENLEGTEDGHADVSVTLICVHLPLHEHLIIQLLPESSKHRSTEAMNPLSEASAVGKQRKRNSQELENLR
jgi:hypothetical protein